MTPITNNRVVDVIFSNETLVEPVELEDAKRYMRIDFDDEDALISQLIVQAREHIERVCGISIISRTVKAVVEMVNRVELPYGPVKEVVTHVGTTVLGTQFPRVEGCGKFEVEYKAGYSPVPADLKLAIKAEVLYRFTNRGDELPQRLSTEAQKLCWPFNRVLWV